MQLRRQLFYVLTLNVLFTIGCSIPTQPEKNPAANAERAVPLTKKSLPPEKNYDDALRLVRAGEYRAALPILQNLISAGDAGAKTLLASMHMMGFGVPVNQDKAMLLLEDAATSGFVEAQYLYGINANNHADKIKWLEKAALQAHVDAQISLAEIYLDIDDTDWFAPEKAAKWLAMAAAENNAEAHFLLGEIHWFNEIPTADDSVAVSHFLQSLKAGYSMATYYLASANREGRGVPQNIEKALFYYRLAVNDGDTDAMLDMGEMYWFGDGVQQDCAMALYLYEQRANAYADYQNELAWFLSTADCHLTTVRNGARAIEIMHGLLGNDILDSADPHMVDTLAAAYAENGEFAKAVETQKLAIELLKKHEPDRPVASYLLRLNRYENDLPERIGAAI